MGATRRRERAAGALKRLREELAGDRVALGTVECIAKGDSKPLGSAPAIHK